MRVFNSIPEPWAKIVSVLATGAIGVWFYFRIGPGFGVGMACGGLACMLIHWGARLDERPFWKHVFGRSRVYPENSA